MQGIQWDESMSVGVELIDDQHRNWLGHLNDVSAAVKSHEGPDRVGDTLGFLVDYTNLHFATEEKYMAQTGYPGSDEHRGKHAELKTTLADLVREFREEGPTHALAEAVDTFLASWLIKHIHEIDLPFGRYLTEQGIIVTDTQ